MKKLMLLPALLCLAGGCTRQQAGTFTHTVMLTQPVRLGAENVKQFSGVVQERHDIALGFKTAGQIEEIAVKEGDYVKQGQLIARLDDADYRLGVEALEIQCRQLEDEVSRTEQLFRSKSVSANDYEKARAGLEQLRIQLQANRNKLDYTRLYAPVAGIIDKVNFDEAEMVDAGTPVVTLLDVSAREVEADVPAEVYLNRSRISGATCRPVAGGGGPVAMKVASLTPKADANQLYRLRLGFDGEPQPWLTAGMNVEVELRFGGASGARRFGVPLRAVFQDGGRTFVWTVGPDGKVRKTAVTLGGTTDGGAAVVTSGLVGGERVVRAGVDALRDGEPVEIVAEGSPTNVGNLL